MVSFQERSALVPSVESRLPVLLVGHGTRDDSGRQALIDLATAYQQLDTDRPVVPCFLELTGPTILEGIEQCIEQGHTELVVLPVLLFAARHNKFDVTAELDRARLKYPQLRFHYGRHFGIRPEVIELLHDRLQTAEQADTSGIERSETVVLLVGRGASDPDANGDVYKLARLLWEGSGYQSVEVCFIGITHPRLEQGFERALLLGAKRVIVLPYFLFTGVLVKKIQVAVELQCQNHPEITFLGLPEIGLHPLLLTLLQEREREAAQGEVSMNCEMCKFRRAALNDSAHDHGHSHGHDHGHGHHHHDHDAPDPYAQLDQYHGRIWNVP